MTLGDLAKNIVKAVIPPSIADSAGETENQKMTGGEMLNALSIRNDSRRENTCSKRIILCSERRL